MSRTRKKEKEGSNELTTCILCVFEYRRSEDSTTHSVLRHLCWIANDKVAYVQYDEHEEADMLYLAKLLETEGKLQVYSTSSLGKGVGRLYYNTNYNDLVVESMDGTVRRGKAKKKRRFIICVRF